MAINQNHQFEDLNGVKCAIVEKNCNEARVIFLKALLEHNGYTVVVAAAAPPKAAPAAAPAPTATPAPATAATPATSPAPVSAPSPSPAPGAPAATQESQPAPTPAPPPTPDIPPPPPPPSLFTVGVTDVMFNATNAIFGRLLKTQNGKLVTLAYWQQKDEEPRVDVPYFRER